MADRVPQDLTAERELDRHVMAAVGELGVDPLRHAVVGTRYQQNAHLPSPVSVLGLLAA